MATVKHAYTISYFLYFPNKEVTPVILSKVYVSGYTESDYTRMHPLSVTIYVCTKEVTPVILPKV